MALTRAHKKKQKKNILCNIFLHNMSHTHIIYKSKYTNSILYQKYLKRFLNLISILTKNISNIPTDSQMTRKLLNL